MREQLRQEYQPLYSRHKHPDQRQGKIIYDVALSKDSQLFQALASLEAKPILRPGSLHDIDIVFCKEGTNNLELVPLKMTYGKFEINNCVALRLVKSFDDPNHYGIDVDFIWYRRKSPYRLAPDFQASVNDASLVTLTYELFKKVSWEGKAIYEFNSSPPIPESEPIAPDLPTYEKVTRPNKKINLRQLKISGAEIRQVMKDKEVGLTGNPWINRCIVWKTRLKLLKAVKAGTYPNTKEDLLVRLYKILDTNNLNDFNPRIELPSPQSAENELLPSDDIVEFIHDIYENHLGDWDTQVTYPQVSFSKIAETTRMLLNLYSKNYQEEKSHQGKADPVIRGTIVHTFQTVAMAIATGQTGRDIQFLLPTTALTDLEPFITITEGLSATDNPLVLHDALERATLRFFQTPDIFPKAEDFEDYDPEEVSGILCNIENDTIMQGNVIGMAYQIADEFFQETVRFASQSHIYKEVMAILNITGNPLGVQLVTRFDNLGSSFEPNDNDCEKYMYDLKTRSSSIQGQDTKEFSEQDAVTQAIDKKVEWVERMMLRYATEIFNHTFFADGHLQPNGSPLVLKKDYKKWDPNIQVAYDFFNMITNTREKLDIIEASPEEKNEFLYLFIHGLIPWFHICHDQSAFELVLDKVG